jgi:cyanophycin synthetase
MTTTAEAEGTEAEGEALAVVPADSHPPLDDTAI